MTKKCIGGDEKKIKQALKLAKTKFDSRLTGKL